MLQVFRLQERSDTQDLGGQTLHLLLSDDGERAAEQVIPPSDHLFAERWQGRSRDEFLGEQLQHE